MSTEPKRIFDCLYCHREDAQELIELYPDATVSDDSDDIHGNRTGILIESETKRNYLKNVMKTGLALVSLCYQAALVNAEDAKMLSEILSEIKEEADVRFDDNADTERKLGEMEFRGPTP